jgi:hypothetical protein
MKPGTLVRLPDGREGRAVYHNLDGYGIRWGRDPIEEGDLPPPEAMLREPYPAAIRDGIECVGRDYEVVTD